MKKIAPEKTEKKEVEITVDATSFKEELEKVFYKNAESLWIPRKGGDE